MVRRTDIWKWTLAWGVCAAALIGLGVYDDAFLLIPISIWTPPLIAALWWRRDPSLRAWARGVDIRWLALIHLTRVGFGAAFLLRLSRGTLPWEFALHAGVGDILAGLGAGALMWFAPDASRARRAWRIWNKLALADIILVFVSAQYLLFSGRFEELVALRTFPYVTLPCFVVPMILVTHGLMIWGRLRADPEG